MPCRDEQPGHWFLGSELSYLSDGERALCNTKGPSLGMYRDGKRHGSLPWAGQDSGLQRPHGSVDCDSVVHCAQVGLTVFIKYIIMMVLMKRQAKDRVIGESLPCP